MSIDITALRAEYAEWKAQRTTITVSQRVLSVFRAAPLTARQAYDALGISNQCGSRLLANAITNLCQLGLLRADSSRPRRYRFIQDSSQPVPAAVRAQQKAEAKARSAVHRELSYKRRMQATHDAQLRKARRRGTAIQVTPLQQPATPARPTANPGSTETIEQFITRGGRVETLPHNFDTRPTTFPGRRPTNNHNQRGRSQP